MIQGSELTGQLLVTSESGKLIEVDTASLHHKILYQHPLGESIFGVTWHDKDVYLTGATFVARGQFGDAGFRLKDMQVPFEPHFRGQVRSAMRWFWTKVGAHSRVIPYDKPGLHQLNRYGSSLYVTAASWNEIWVLDLDLRIRERIPLQPHFLDYYHLNNVFCDGSHFYVCLNRYAGRPGLGGYARFDLAWNEVERRAMGWESHAFSVIEGKFLQLCCFSWRSLGQTQHPQRAGLMLNGEFVFEYDPRQYFCKDFSMDDDHIYIVGGSNTRRDQRSAAIGVVFVLNRQFQLLDQRQIGGLGGFNGCRLRGRDYSKGYAPIDQCMMMERSQLA